MAGGFSMSETERERASLVRQATEARVSQREASERLGVGSSQFKRGRVRIWRAEGNAGLVCRQRGRPSHRRTRGDVRARMGGPPKNKEGVIRGWLNPRKWDKDTRIILHSGCGWCM
jgi:hypothetical protein